MQGVVFVVRKIAANFILNNQELSVNGLEIRFAISDYGKMLRIDNLNL